MAERRRIDADVRFPTDTELDESADAEVMKRIAELYEDLDTRDLQPLWTQNEQLMGLEPRPEAIPYLWKKQVLWEMAERSAELITIHRGGDRRVLSLANPGLGGQPFATPTLWGAIQYLNPHESAPGHRHTPGAIRFVLEGEGTWTTVNGDACDMSEGDLILTPPWTWHDHSNESDARMVWFDGLDLPFVKMVNAVFFEQYPVEELQPIQGHNVSERVYGGRATVPHDRGDGAVGPHSPLLVYRYSDTDATLAAMLEEAGGPMVSLTYANPLTGRSVMPTLDCEMHRIGAGGRTRARRKVGSSVFVAFRGRGATVINGERFEWQPGDMFAVPSWALVDHEAEEEADLFAISDAPIMKALALYREEEMEGSQQVRGSFEPKRG